MLYPREGKGNKTPQHTRFLLVRFYFFIFHTMVNILSFLQLQGLYRILELTDCRCPSDIVGLAPTFNKLNDNLAKLESEQGVIRDEMQPFLRRYQEETKDGNQPSDELKKELDIANTKVEEFQNHVPEIEWTPEDKTVINNAVQFVLTTHGTQHPTLKGYQNIQTLSKVVEQFEIKDRMIGE